MKKGYAIFRKDDHVEGFVEVYTIKKIAEKALACIGDDYEIVEVNIEEE